MLPNGFVDHLGQFVIAKYEIVEELTPFLNSFLLHYFLTGKKVLLFLSITYFCPVTVFTLTKVSRMSCGYSHLSNNRGGWNKRGG